MKKNETFITGNPPQKSAGPEKTTDVIQLICQRRSIRKYKDLPVNMSLVKQIIAAGKMAPSAMNKQPWRFHLLTQRNTIQAFSKEIAKVGLHKMIRSGPKQILRMIGELLHFNHGLGMLKAKDPVFHGAPVVIFISAPKENEWAALDIGMCCQNMMLAAKSLSLGSCPIGFGKFVEQTKLYSLLEIPDSDQVHLALAIGYADEEPVAHKRTSGDIHFIDSIEK